MTFKKRLFALLRAGHANKNRLFVNPIQGCRCNYAICMITIIITTLFCFSGCGNESKIEQLALKPPITDEKIEETLKEKNVTGKRRDVTIDPETASKFHVYWFSDDGYNWFISSYKKEGSMYLDISIKPSSSPGKIETTEKKLSDVISVACALYDDGIKPKEFEGIWNRDELQKDFKWRKTVGENIISVNYVPKPYANSATVTIEKKSWADTSSMSFTKIMLWGYQNVSLKEHISACGDITSNKATPIKSCYILNGDIVDVKKLVNKTSLPNEKELFSTLNRKFLVPENAEYYEATIKDTSGEIKVILPTSLIVSESELDHYKYFVLFEYNTDSVKSYYVIRDMRSLDEELLKDLSE